MRNILHQTALVLNGNIRLLRNLLLYKLQLYQVHQTTKMFPSEICSKEFARKDVLRRHIRWVHDGKQYQCDVCSKEFAGRDALRRHIRCAHDQTEFKEHVCQRLPVHATPIKCPGIKQFSAKKPKRTDPAESLDASSTESSPTNIAADAPVHSPAKKKL